MNAFRRIPQNIASFIFLICGNLPFIRYAAIFPEQPQLYRSAADVNTKRKPSHFHTYSSSSETLIGSAPDVTKNLIELRGIGIVDVKALFGVSAVKDTQSLAREF